jgi:glycosyltransferase involved in cell wall biosynthesis
MIRYLRDYWATQTDAPTLTILDARGLGPLFVSPLLLIRTIFQMTYYRLVKRVRLIHINMADKGSVVRKFVIVWVAKALGIKTILHLHAGGFIAFYDRLGDRPRAIVRHLFQTVDRVLVLGEIWKSHLVEQLHVNEQKISVVHNGAPSVGRAKHDRPPGCCRLAFFGRISEEKGIGDLIAAMSLPAMQSLDWKCTFAGNGDIEYFMDQAAAAGIADRLEFLGWLDRPKAKALLLESDIMVLPSRFEGLPMTVLEALSAGVTVVATRVGAVPEILTSDLDSILVDANAPQSLSDELARAVRDKNLRRRLGLAGRELYEANFTVAEFARRIQTIYSEVSH